MGIRIGVDIGGTFTDFAIAEESGRFRVFKTPSTPSTPEQGIVNGIEALAAEAGVSVSDFLGDVDLFIHGTTIATNTVIQRNGPKIGVLHTEGFRDILFLRDGHKPDRYNLHMAPPDPFVPRHLRLGVEERILYDGSIEKPLDEASLRETLRNLSDEGVQSVAICLLWSMVNSAHEDRVLEIIAEEMPSVYAAASHDILPALREYPRACATTLSAYVGPVLGRYLTKVAGYLRDNGYRHELLIMQMTGGSANVSEIEKRPVLAIGSGPAAGPAGALRAGGDVENGNLMIVDMGGTSFDVSLINGGSFSISRELEIESMPVGIAAVDVHSVGAGGGSIAWIDNGGMLRVGPRSAGADPGPACYGRGEEPTVTDANVVLGYLNPAFFLGGRMKLDHARSEAALTQIAEPLGISVVEAAAAVYRIVNTNMVGAMRAVSVMRGIDPRDYTVVVGGGAGGTHAAKIAEELDMGQVICPTVAGGLCAFGMLAADVRQTYLTTYPTNTDKLEIAEVEAIFGEMEQRAVHELETQGFTRDEIVLERSVDAKYPYQLHELIVAAPAGDIATMAKVFHDQHERLYSYCMRDMPVDMNGWRLTALGKLPKLADLPLPTGNIDATYAAKEKRAVFFADIGSFVDTQIYDGEVLKPGVHVEGPGIIELPTTTLVVCPGHTLGMNLRGDFIITIPEAANRPSVSL